MMFEHIRGRPYYLQAGHALFKITLPSMPFYKLTTLALKNFNPTNYPFWLPK